MRLIILAGVGDGVVVVAVVVVTEGGVAAVVDLALFVFLPPP